MKKILKLVRVYKIKIAKLMNKIKLIKFYKIYKIKVRNENLLIKIYILSLYFFLYQSRFYFYI